MAKLNELPQKAIALLKKYKYAALVFVIGIAILLLPIGKTEKKAEQAQSAEVRSDDDYVAALEERLTALLSQVKGAGAVQVMLTLQVGSRTEYQTDTQTSEDVNDNEKRSSEERKTVILSEGSAYDKAAVSAVRYPQFQGALIVSEGADQPSVRLDLIRAVAALTGLNSSQITVVKLK
ncbi:MAG: stage III sporulation protein AG [Oscillospiraceae bacterium]|nr:stage III sporulation protein AG [Oscillospiraceae bacterium]